MGAPVVGAIVLISFLLLRAVPGDPATALVGEFPAPPEYIAQVRQDFGLDQPVVVQLWLYVSHLVRGDLGFSFVNRQFVGTLLLERAGRTLSLMLPSLIASSILGVLLAFVAARRPGSFVDLLVSAISVLGYSTPIFWFGQLMIIVFAVKLRWLPAQGMSSLKASSMSFPATIADFLQHFAMPAFAIICFYTGVIARVARASIGDVLHQDFMLTALAKGVSESDAVRKHALPNAMIPIVGVIGYNFGNALTGTIMVEAVFAWPGLGGLFLTSITNRDYPVLQGIFLMSALTVVCANLVTDVVYGLIDVRVRVSGRG